MPSWNTNVICVPTAALGKLEHLQGLKKTGRKCLPSVCRTASIAAG